MTEFIRSEFLKNGIELSEKQVEQFKTYCDFLLEYNEKVNLTAVTDKAEVVRKHFLDSAIASAMLKENAVCADIGTGAGFPGVPLAIMRNDITVALIDSLNKRLVFLDELKERIGLENVYTVHGRSEDLGRDAEFRQKFDYAFSRAVARLNVLAEYDLPFVKKGGEMLAWKGPQAYDEVEEARNAIKILGGGNVQIHTAELDDTEHYIVKIDKISDTPIKYPRQAGILKKKPL